MFANIMSIFFAILFYLNPYCISFFAFVSIKRFDLQDDLNDFTTCGAFLICLCFKKPFNFFLFQKILVRLYVMLFVVDNLSAIYIYIKHLNLNSECIN